MGLGSWGAGDGRTPLFHQHPKNWEGRAAMWWRQEGCPDRDVVAPVRIWWVQLGLELDLGGMEIGGTPLFPQYPRIWDERTGICLYDEGCSNWDLGSQGDGDEGTPLFPSTPKPRRKELGCGHTRREAPVGMPWIRFGVSLGGMRRGDPHFSTSTPKIQRKELGCSDAGRDDQLGYGGSHWHVGPVGLQSGTPVG